MHFSVLSTSRYCVFRSSSSALNSGSRDMSGGLTTNASMSNCDIAYRIECIVRIRMSPTHSTFSPSSLPLDSQIV